jgi:triacylglycerol lipase
MEAMLSLSPRRQRMVIVIVVASAVLGALLAFQLLGGAEPQQEGVPVVVVPGYGADADSVSVLAERLRRGNRQVEALTLPENGTGDIGLSAAAIRDAVGELGAESVDFVGFSAGGVVVREYLRGLGGAASARRVVLLGSPNHGAEAAELAASFDPSVCVRACAQLAPGSSFLEELNSGDETPGDADYISIWTSLDQTVTPATSAVLRGAINVRVQDVCPDARTGHGDLVTDSLALALVVEALNGRLDEPPSTSDCARLTAN